MKFQLEIQVDSASFGESDGERAAAVAEILRKTADKVETNRTYAGSVLDYNGSYIGDWLFKS